MPSSWYCSVEVSCTKSGIEIDYSRVGIIRHFVEVFKAVTGYQGGFFIRAKDHQHQHVGLGSTRTIMIALANALNYAVGAPLTSDQLPQTCG